MDIQAMYQASLMAVAGETEAKANADTAKATAFDCHKAFVELYIGKGRNSKAGIKTEFKELCQKNSLASLVRWPRDERGGFAGYQKAIAAGCPDAKLYNAFAKHCDTKLDENGVYITTEMKNDKKRTERIKEQEEKEKIVKAQGEAFNDALDKAADEMPLEKLLSLLEKHHGAKVTRKENVVTVKITTTPEP